MKVKLIKDFFLEFFFLFVECLFTLIEIFLGDENTKKKTQLCWMEAFFH